MADKPCEHKNAETQHNADGTDGFAPGVCPDCGAEVGQLPSWERKKTGSEEKPEERQAAEQKADEEQDLGQEPTGVTGEAAPGESDQSPTIPGQATPPSAGNRPPTPSGSTTPPLPDPSIHPEAPLQREKENETKAQIEDGKDVGSSDPFTKKSEPGQPAP